MPISLVSVLGRPLTVEEFDGNFTTLQAMIDYVTANPVAGVGVSNITQAGATITFHMSNGTTRGPFTLPKANFRYRNDWTPATNYVIGDFVRVGSTGLYVVLVNHLSEAVFDPDYEPTVGNPAYELAVPFFAPAQTWLTVIPEGTDLVAILDLDLSDKFLLITPDDVEVAVPINGYPGQPFALRVQIDGSPATVTFDASYLGAAPTVLSAAGDETVLGGMILDMDMEATDPGTTAVINTLKEIPA